MIFFFIFTILKSSMNIIIMYILNCLLFTVCNDGTYVSNLDCVKCLGVCKLGAPCNKTTGICDNGCTMQRTGTFCEGIYIKNFDKKTRIRDIEIHLENCWSLSCFFYYYQQCDDIRTGKFCYDICSLRFSWENINKIFFNLQQI